MADYADPIKCSAVEKNSHVMIKNRPCKIVEISASDDDQVNLRGSDIFTLKSLEDTFPSDQDMEVPIIKQTEFLLLDIDDGLLMLQGEDGNIKEDLKIPEGKLGEDITWNLQDGVEVVCTVQSACGEEHVIASHQKRWKCDLFS